MTVCAWTFVLCTLYFVTTLVAVKHQARSTKLQAHSARVGTQPLFSKSISTQEVLAQINDRVMKRVARITRFETKFAGGLGAV